MGRLAACILALVLAVGQAARAQTIAPTFFGNSVEFTDTTAWPKLYVAQVRDWYSDCSSNPANMNNVFPTSITPTFTTLDCVVGNYKAHVGNQQIYTFGLFPGWCNGSQTADFPCTLESNYVSMVNLISAHEVGKIKYYEPLNEVNLAGAPTAGWFSGTKAQVVTMAADMCSTVKANDPSVLCLSPSVEGATGPAYMQALLNLGIAADFDIFNYHGYAFNAFPNQFPEQTAYIAQAFKQLAALYSISSKPIWVDEGGYQPSLATALQPAYTSIFLIDYASAGVAQVDWFQYDNGNSFGVLWDGAAGLNAAGLAYKITEGWLIGATFTANTTRTANTNLVPNPTATGLSAGTPGTAPTGWSISNPDSGHGISTSVVGSCTDGTRTGLAERVFGTETAGGQGFVDILYTTGTGVAAANNQQWQPGAYVQLQAGSTANATFALQFNENTSGGAFIANDMSWVFNPTADVLGNDLITYFGRTTSASTAAVQPYVQVNYTVGAAIDATLCIASASIDNGSVWTATITRPGGYQGQIVWDSHGDVAPSSYTFPAGQGYVSYRDLFGQNTPLSGSTVTITNNPIIIENSVWKGIVGASNDSHPVPANDNGTMLVDSGDTRLSASISIAPSGGT